MSDNVLVKAETRLPKFVEDAYETVEKMENFANILLKSKLVPNHFYEKLPDGKPDFDKGKTASVVAVLIQGYQLQLPPLTALQHIIPVNGLLSIKGDLAKSMIFNSGKLKPGSWVEKEEGSIEQENFIVMITAARSDNGQTLTRSFSVANAKRAGLWITQQQVNGQDGWKYKSSSWYKYPARMINYRALGFIARDLFPDVMAGIYTTEEATDMPVDQTVVIDQGNGVSLQIPDRSFAEGRSRKITERAVDKIKAPDFAPVDATNVSVTPPPVFIPPTPIEEMPVYEGPHEVGPLVDEMERGHEFGTKEDIHKNPITPDQAFRKLTIAQMTDMETEDLLKIIKEDSELSEALMLIPGKNTNKKLREIIFAHQEGTLREYLKPFEEAALTPEEKMYINPTPEADTNVKDELIQPSSTELNKYKLFVPAFNKGNERDFATKKELYHVLSGLTPSLNNERFIELQRDLPQFAHYANKEAFCQFATIAEVCELLNRN